MYNVQVESQETPQGLFYCFQSEHKAQSDLSHVVGSCLVSASLTGLSSFRIWSSSMPRFCSQNKDILDLKLWAGFPKIIYKFQMLLSTDPNSRSAVTLSSQSVCREFATVRHRENSSRKLPSTWIETPSSKMRRTPSLSAVITKANCRIEREIIFLPTGLHISVVPQSGQIETIKSWSSWNCCGEEFPGSITIYPDSAWDWNLTLAEKKQCLSLGMSQRGILCPKSLVRERVCECQPNVFLCWPGAQLGHKEHCHISCSHWQKKKSLNLKYSKTHLVGIHRLFLWPYFLDIGCLFVTCPMQWQTLKNQVLVEGLCVGNTPHLIRTLKEEISSFLLFEGKRTEWVPRVVATRKICTGLKKKIEKSIESICQLKPDFIACSELIDAVTVPLDSSPSPCDK